MNTDEFAQHLKTIHIAALLRFVKSIGFNLDEIGLTRIQLTGLPHDEIMRLSLAELDARDPSDAF